MRASWSFVLIFLVFLSPSSGFSQSTVGQVLSIKGEAVAYSKNRPLQRLAKGSRIPTKVVIITRKSSSVLLRLLNGEKLLINESSKVTINKSLIVLNSSHVIYKDINQYNYFKFKFKGIDQIFQGSHFSVNKQKLKAIGRQKIKHYTLRNDPIKNEQNQLLQISKDLDDLKKGSSSDDMDNEIMEDDDEEMLDEDDEELMEDDSDGGDVFSSGSTDDSEINDMFGGASAVIDTTASSASAVIEDETLDDISDLLDIDWKVKVFSTLYFSKPEEISNIDNSSFHFDARVNFSDKITLSDKTSFSHSGWLETSNRKEVRDDSAYSVTGRETKKPLFVLNEYYWFKSFSKFDVTVGKKIVRLGKGMLVSPADRLSPSDSIIPTSAQRLGIFNTSFDLYLGDSTLSFIWVPVLNTTKSPHPYSRWSTRRDGVFFDINSKYPSGQSWESTQSLIKFETTLKGIDMFAALFNGANPDPVIKNEITVAGNTPSFQVQQEFVPVTNLSMGFSTTFGALEIHGEGLKQNAKEGRDDSYSQLMGGFRYSFDEWPTSFGLQQIDVILEYVKETVDQSISYPYTLFSSIQSRIFKNNTLGSVNFKVSDNLQYNLGFNFDLEYSGMAYLLGLGYRLSNLGRITMRFESYSGDEESIFSKWDTNDNLVFEYSQDF